MLRPLPRRGMVPRAGAIGEKCMAGPAPGRRPRLLRAVENCRGMLPGHLRFERGDIISFDGNLPGRSRGWAIGRVLGSNSEIGCFRMSATEPLVKQ